MAKLGRPVTVNLNQEQMARALEMAIEGRTISDICEALGVTTLYFWKFRRRCLKFESVFAECRRQGIDFLVDSLISIPDQTPDVYRARLKSDNIKWVAARRAADVYGDRVDVNMHQTVDIGAALKEARERALPGRYSDAQIVEQPLDITDILPGETTDNESVSGESGGFDDPDELNLEDLLS